MSKRASFVLVLAVMAALGLARSPSSLAIADGFVVICNAKASTSALSRAELKALYTGKSKTLGGAAVVVVVRPEDDAPFTQFVDQIFGVADLDFQFGNARFHGVSLFFLAPVAQCFLRWWRWFVVTSLDQGQGATQNDDQANAENNPAIVHSILR